jgi:hypothetical protein
VDNKLPAAALGGDIGIAAPGSTHDGFGYIGVWTASAADCVQIGLPSSTAGFAVITTSTYRDGPSACYGNFKGMTDGKGALQMSCSGTQKSVQLEQSTPDSLSIDGKAMVRCAP